MLRSARPRPIWSARSSLMLLVAALLALVPGAAQASVAGPTIQAYDPAGDAAAGASSFASDLLSVRYEGTNYDGTAPHLKLRARGASLGRIAVFFDTDRDRSPDRIVTFTQSAAGLPVYVAIGRPPVDPNHPLDCTAAALSTTTRTLQISATQSGSDWRADLPLQRSDLNPTGAADGDGGGVAPLVAAVSLDGVSSSDVGDDWLPDAAGTTHPGARACSMAGAFGLPLDLVAGALDRGQGAASVSHLIDRAGDADDGAADLLEAAVKQYTARQFTDDITASPTTSTNTTTVHPADVDMTLGSGTAESAVGTTIVLYDGWDDTNTTGAAIGAVHILSGSDSTHVRADYYVKGSGGTPVTSCQAPPDSMSSLVALRSTTLATSLDANGHLTLTVPLDLALGVWNGAGVDQATWRVLIAGDKLSAQPDFVPDTVKSASATVCSPGFLITPDALPLIHFPNYNGPIARLTVSPTSGPKPTDIALDASASQVFVGAPRISIDGRGTGTFSVAANGKQTLTAQRASGTARVIVEDSAGGVDMAKGTYTLTAQDPVARVTPDPAVVVVPHDSPGTRSITLDGASSSDPDADPGAPMGGIATYRWQLLKNAISTGQTATTASFTPQAFQASDRTATWTARLTVTDVNDGRSSTVDRPITVERGPWAKVSDRAPASLNPGTAVTFNARAQDSASGGDAGPFTYDWDIDGNGTYESLDRGPTWSTTAPAAGSYTARVRVTDQLGNVDVSDASDGLAYVVTPPGLTAPTAAITATTGGHSTPPARPRSGQDPVTFDATGSTYRDPTATPTSYRWSFGDGTPDVDTTTRVTTHTYAGSGPVIASVSVTDRRSGSPNPSVPATIALTVDPGPTDANAPSATLVRTLPPAGSVFATQQATVTAVDVVNHGVGALQWLWDLDGDGSFETDTGAAASVTTIYPTAGTRVVRAQLTDPDGRVAVTAPISLEVRGAPVAAPTVTLSAPDTVKLAGEYVDIPLDATGSTGNNEDRSLTYAFDLDGNGSFETQTGATPTATAKISSRGIVKLGVKVTDIYGNVATATKDVAVTSQADALAGCVGKAILRTVSIGPIKASACFAQIDRGSAGPLFIASGNVDLSGLQITGAAGSTVVPREFPDCSSTDCVDAQKAFNTNTSSASIALDTAAGHIWSARPLALKMAGSDVNFPLSLGPLDYELPFGKTADGFVVRVNDRSASLLGLPITGEAEVRFPSDGTTLVDVNAALPSILGSITTKVSVEAHAGEGARLNNLTINVDAGLLAKKLVLKKLAFVYSRADRSFEGAAQLKIPFEKSFDLGTALRVKDGELQSLYGEVGGLNRHLGKGVFLQAIRAGFTVNPASLTGGVGLTLGPRLKIAGLDIALVAVDGDFTMRLPVDGQAFVLAIVGKATLANRLPLADASIAVSQNGLVVLHGGVGGDYKVGYLTSTIDGWVASDAFNARGDASVGVKIGDHKVKLAGASAVVSSVGIAACGEVPVINLGAGLGYRWGDSFATFEGCDLSPYEAARPADLPSSLSDVLKPGDVAADGSRAALGMRVASVLPRPAARRGRRVVVPVGTRELSLSASGAGGAPALVVATANGRKLIDTTTDQPLTADHLIVPDPDHFETTVLIKHPPAGVIYVADGGAPATLTAVRTAVGQPSPKIKARVSGRSARRTLTWSVRPRLATGQTVQLAEETASGAGRPIITTTRSVGHAAFAPSAGAGRRTITATVLDPDGMARHGVARAGGFTVAVDRPAAPTRLHLVRRGRVITSTWSGKAPAGFELTATSTTGVQQAVTQDGRRFMFPELPAASGAAITVTALGRLGERSRGIAATLVAAQVDSRKPLTMAAAAPRSVSAKRKGSALAVSWKPGSEAVRGWKVIVKPKAGIATTLLVPAAGRRATVRATSAKALEGASVAVVALRFGGHDVTVRTRVR